MKIHAEIEYTRKSEGDDRMNIFGAIIYRPVIGTILREAAEQAWELNDEVDAVVVLQVNGVEVRLKKMTNVPQILSDYRSAKRSGTKHK